MILRELSSYEIQEWMAYCTVEPFGYWNDWHQTGEIAHTIYQMNRSSKSPDLKVIDFMPKQAEARSRARASKKQTAAEQKEILLSIFRSAERQGLTTKTQLPGPGTREG